MEIRSVDKVSNLPVSDTNSSVKAPVKENSFNPFSSADSSAYKKDSSVSEANPFAQKTLNPVDAHNTARTELLKFFKQDFSKSDEFKRVFGAETKWEDVADSVIAKIQLHRNKAAEAELQGKAFCFTADMAGMTGEVAIDKKSGSVRAISMSAE